MDLHGKSVLITGGAGLIGSTITDQVLHYCGPSRVVVIDDLTRGTKHNLSAALGDDRVTFCRADIRHFKSIRPLFEGIDAVFHQAAIRITRCAQEPRDCVDVLVLGTFNVLQACVEAKVGKVVAASSASVYGMANHFPTTEFHHPYNNRTIYGAAKVANEGFLRSFYDMYGLPYVALRYFNVYGPRMDIFGKYTEVLIRWLDCLDRGEAPKIFGDGMQTMDFVFSEDVARANLLAMQREVSDEVLNVGSGTETSLLELLNALLQVCGKIDVKPEFLPERSINPVPRRLSCVRRAADKIGFRSEVSLEEGLRRLVDWRRSALQSGTMAAYVTDPAPEQR
jgi:UDP-glucose 4-epimerase